MTADKLLRRVNSDAQGFGIRDERSVLVLALGRVAQAALSDEIASLRRRDCSKDEIADYQQARVEQLNSWLASEMAAEVRRQIG